jgi:dTDP-4-amino-4,6-dideoxygalactose transaminase
MKNKIFVTKSFLPPINEYEKYLKLIWKSSQLTNQGPLLTELEEKLKKYLEVQYFHFMTNGTIALQLALNSLDITEGEVITTPFSYVATTSTILWERCTPVFVDINKETLCIDPEKIEAAITKKTRAIMAVHVFGYPCDVEKIEAIAKKHKLKVIYDGAHAFGCIYKNKSLLQFGDVSMCSFHATKLFHTIEGGCLITNNKKN